MHVARITRESLAVRARPGRVRAIGLIPGQIATEVLEVKPRIEHDEVVADPENDLAKLVVCERHRATGRLGCGFVVGLGLRHGAIASSVATT